MKSRALAIAALVLLAGCGGGGSSPASGPAQTPQNPTQTPLQNSANLVVSFPVGGSKTSSSQRTPKFVSPGSTQIVVTVNSVNGGSPPSWVPATTSTALNFAGGGNCTVTSGTATCTIPVAAPPGSVNYTIAAEDASNTVLATTTTTLTMVQGTNNTPTVTLHGVVKTVTVTGSTLVADSTALATTGEVLTVSAFDGGSPTPSQIVNGTTSANYNNPITLTDDETSTTGQTAISVNGGTYGASVVVNNPSDVVRLRYTGQAADPFTITASGTGISGGGNIGTTVFDVIFTGTTDDTAANGGLNTDTNWGQQTVFFSSPSGSQNISAAEAGFTDSPFSKSFDLDAGPNTAPWCTFYGNTIATFSPNTPATTFTVTASGVGVCKARLKEHGTSYPITSHTANVSGSETHDGTFWVSVTSANFTVNGKRHQTH